MPLSAGFFGDLGGAVGNFFGAIGDEKEATAYKNAAKIAGQNAGLAARSTDLNTAMADRKVFQTLGAERADTAAAGFQMSGSALDLMRSSTEQGALTKQIIQNQGEQQVLGYQEEQQAELGKAAAAKAAAGGGFLSSLLGVAGAALSLF